MIDFFFIRYYKSNPLPYSFDEICLLCLVRLPSLDSVTCFFLEAFTLVASLAAKSIKLKYCKYFMLLYSKINTFI